MMHGFVEQLIQSLKHDENYQLDPALTLRTLLQVLSYRGIAFARGSWRQLWLSGRKQAIFVGAHVTMRHPQLISVGRGVIIEDYVTIDALSRNGVILGNNVTIGRFATIQCSGVIRSLGSGLVIGDNSAVGAYSFLGAQGGIQIGNDVIMGPRVSLHAENHQYLDVKTPIRLQGETREGIVVEDDCWIGAGSIILDGVRIGSGSVVAAGSVVTRSQPSYSVVGGVPATIIGQRT